MTAIMTKRIYDAPAASDGARVLVDRLWPRGVRRDAADLTGWFRDIAPSNALRAVFHHKPELWDAFCERYAQELDAHPEALKPLEDLIAKGPVTLLYAARETTYNNAVALKSYLEKRLG
ncbi:DUF488 domain-containing protein [Chelatococcus asaccharovorans]|uniref:Uncharacterized protein YeaO (DUF488 family) n=1 Tax=Chelatococcus asaccharovorans TaxID=28210 RepID=A0A2V3TUG4_9HYPH|nr:DUF488 family protein [Chelatococcus asaccharovorans]MBS7702103.1 DUF488 family protein [Chelatococcus asaccharovorans]PXW52873.1 uncharacterized protein YeaO (DUF488 family) [Chelatococcus asaccharovorans]